MIFYEKSLAVSKKCRNFALVSEWTLFTNIGIWCNWQHYRFWSCHSWFESEYPNRKLPFILRGSFFVSIAGSYRQWQELDGLQIVRNR